MFSHAAREEAASQHEKKLLPNTKGDLELFRRRLQHTRYYFEHTRRHRIAVVLIVAAWNCVNFTLAYHYRRGSFLVVAIGFIASIYMLWGATFPHHQAGYTARFEHYLNHNLLHYYLRLKHGMLRPRPPLRAVERR